MVIIKPFEKQLHQRLCRCCQGLNSRPFNYTVFGLHNLMFRSVQKSFLCSILHALLNVRPEHYLHAVMCHCGDGI